MNVLVCPPPLFVDLRNCNPMPTCVSDNDSRDFSPLGDVSAQRHVPMAPHSFCLCCDTTKNSASSLFELENKIQGVLGREPVVKGCLKDAHQAIRGLCQSHQAVDVQKLPKLIFSIHRLVSMFRDGVSWVG